MFAALAGIALGLALSLGPLIAYDARVSVLAEQMVTAFAAASQALLTKIPYVADSPDVIDTFSTVIAVIAPGLVALLLVMAAKQMKGFRRGASGLLVLGAVGSFFVLPASQAAVLLIGAIVLSGVLLVPVGFISGIALWGLATVIAMDNVMLIWSEESDSVTSGAASFARISGLDAPEFWRMATLVLALTPFALAVLNDSRQSRHS